MPADVTLHTSDDVSLAASIVGDEPRPTRVLLIAAATGVRRHFYHPFAEHLARDGTVVLVWDWRGVGGSRPASLRGFRASMTQWATRDFPAAIDFASARWPAARLHALGHSFGGQALGLLPNADRLASVVTVASQSGYYGHWDPPARWRFALLWHVLLPAVTHAVGYFPSGRFGFGEDLPAGVALEWARWCRSPEYLGDYGGHARFTAPILALSFTDDPYAPRRAVEWLHARYGTRELVHRHIAPDEIGAERIGHFGFFRDSAATRPLWAEAAEWISRR